MLAKYVNEDFIINFRSIEAT